MTSLRKYLMAALAAFGICPLTISAQASDDLMIVPYAQVGYWNILSVREANGRFDHCMATIEYGSGKRVSFNAQAAGGWGFQIHDPAWPERELPAIPAAITVNEVRMEGLPAAFVGRSLFLELGDVQLDLIRQGGTLLIDTPEEIVSLQLYRPAEATDSAIACRHEAR